MPLDLFAFADSDLGSATLPPEQKQALGLVFVDAAKWQSFHSTEVANSRLSYARNPEALVSTCHAFIDAMPAERREFLIGNLTAKPGEGTPVLSRNSYCSGSECLTDGSDALRVLVGRVYGNDVRFKHELFASCESIVWKRKYVQEKAEPGPCSGCSHSCGPYIQGHILSCSYFIT